MDMIPSLLNFAACEDTAIDGPVKRRASIPSGFVVDRKNSCSTPSRTTGFSHKSAYISETYRIRPQVKEDPAVSSTGV
jgi:hypothetical protein